MPFSVPTLREWLAEAPFTLVMSSGFFGFFAHTGVLRALEDEGLVPARAAGSSAGALVTGSFCAGVPAASLAERLIALERREFWDPGIGAGFLRGRRFATLLEAMLPVRTFAECRIPLALSVFDILTRSTRVIDAGPLVPAIAASCTVPLMFHPVRHQGRALYDGGIRDRPGLSGAPPDTRVFYHHLTSRVLGYNVPRRPGMVALEIETLPRVDPFHLTRGRIAIEAAAIGMRRALQRPMSEIMHVH